METTMAIAKIRFYLDFSKFIFKLVKGYLKGYLKVEAFLSCYLMIIPKEV